VPGEREVLENFLKSGVCFITSLREIVKVVSIFRNVYVRIRGG